MSCSSCNYRLRKGRILEKTEPCPGTVLFRIKMCRGYLDFKPGQFIILSRLGYGEIAIGVTTTPDNKEFFEICVRRVGQVTRAICALKVDDLIELRGPYGNGYPLDQLRKKDLLLIAGGIGIAPLRSLFQYGCSHPEEFKSLQVIYGEQNCSRFLYQKELLQKKALLTAEKTDPDWNGCEGKVTKMIEKVRITANTNAVICGPQGMYKPVIRKLLSIGFSKDNIYLMLERRMKCGIGKCQHCTVGDKYVCLDGPVFSFREIEKDQEALC